MRWVAGIICHATGRIEMYAEFWRETPRRKEVTWMMILDEIYV
jgi:hypothetical protein